MNLDPLTILSLRDFDPHTIVWMSVVLVALLSISAFVSGSETAFFSLTHADVKRVKESGGRADKAALRLLADPDYLLATILVVNNLVNICIVILSARIMTLLLDFSSAAWEFVFKTVVVTFLLLLFGEIMPKVLANSAPLRFVRFSAVPMSALRTLFKPLSFILVRSSSKISESAARRRDNISFEELSDAIDITSDQSVEERKMLSGILRFVNTEVAGIMKPRMDIIALERGEGYRSVKETIIRYGFSRIPVYEESLDNIVGVLYVKDLMPRIHGGDDYDWTSLLRKPYFVPEHKKINDLLEEFQANKVHLAIVVDEYGSTLGLVSLEDILEEIVGEITDESDADETIFTRLDERTYLFDGKTHIGDFERALHLDEETFSDVRGEAETIAGMMLELRRDFLKKGESLSVHGITFTVQAIDGHRIEKVKVHLDE